jgi:hypothetical protein
MGGQARIGGVSFVMVWQSWYGQLRYVADGIRLVSSGRVFLFNMKKCKHCSKEFEPKNPKGIFCSDNCRVYFGRRKAKIKPKEDNKKDEQKSEKHKFWKQGDPPENSNAFFLRFGVFTYDEITKA